jgi:putative peptide zinc metalloprotease protein
MTVQIKDSEHWRLSEVKLVLREDLRCSLHEYGGRSCYVVEDPDNSQFYRLGPREWTFVSFLDGKRSVGEALELAAESLGPKRLSSADAARLCRWLVQVNLAHPDSAPRPGRANTSSGRPASPGQRPSFNPFFARIPLCNPDRFLTVLLPWVKWAFSFHGFNLWLCLCSLGVCEVATGWPQFVACSADLLSPDHWIALVLIWSVLKVIHELAHGLVCKKYGGTVPAAGLTLILFSPIAYIDLTSCWRIRSKWQRIFASAAGMYVEWAIAAIAALIWSHTQPGTLNWIAHKVVLMTGLTTILFNVNPLMRFDGYYILSDLLGITNLYPRGQACLRYWGLRYLLGASVGPSPEAGRTGVIIKIYGVATLVWKVLVCISLGAVAATLFHGLGLLLTFVGVALWLGSPLLRLAKYLVRGSGGQRPNLLRAGFRLSLAAGCVAGVLMLPWPTGVVVPAVVEYAPLAVIRVDSPGFVQKVCVKDGEKVQPGQVLLVLTNEELQADRKGLDLEIDQCLLRQRIRYNDGELAKYQVETRNREALETKKRELEKRLGGLVLKAPIRGRVIGRELDCLKGRYLAAGTEVMAIGMENQKELLASLAQRDIDRLKASPESAVFVRIYGRSRPVEGGRLERLSPRATCLLRHPALGAQAGGPLAVRPKEVPAQYGQSEDASSGKYELLAPRFDARIAIPPQEAALLKAGERASVRFNWSYEAIGTRLARWLTDRIQRRLTRANRSRQAT